MLRSSPATLALSIFIVSSCCGAHFVKRTYNAVSGPDAGAAEAGAPNDGGRLAAAAAPDDAGPPDGGTVAAEQTPRLYIAATGKGPYKVGEPFKVNVTLGVPGASADPFELTSLLVEQDGETVLARKPTDPPLVAKLRDPNTKKTTMDLVVPLDELKWVEGSKVTIRAELLIPGRTTTVVAERDFVGTLDERSYTACEHFRMF